MCESVSAWIRADARIAAVIKADAGEFLPVLEPVKSILRRPGQSKRKKLLPNATAPIPYISYILHIPNIHIPNIYIPYFQQHPEWTLIIAPHVVNEERMQQLEQKLSAFHVHRYSQLSEDSVTAPLSREGNEAGALLIDCYGLLSSIYRYADVCYVGGGFGVSIHNTVEAAVWGKPVIFGPNNQKFQEAQELKACEGGFEITDAQSFATLMDRFTSDPDYLRRCSRQAGDYVASRAGATQKVLAATIGSFA